MRMIANSAGEGGASNPCGDQSSWRNSDGRALHRYRLSNDIWEDLTRTLGRDLRAGKRRTIAPDFAVWAAERYRRDYDGGSLSWEFVTDPLDASLKQDEWRHMTAEGLKALRRPIRNSGAGVQYLRTLAAEGGIPIKLLGGDGVYRCALAGIVGELARLGLACPREKDSSGPACIVNSEADRGPVPHLHNDRTIAAWQIYAARHSEKTQDRHLSAIRQFEDHVRGKRFGRLSQEDVGSFRTKIRKTLSAGEAALSKSTVSHILSHVRDFLGWLLKQKDFDKLPRDLPDYLQLSRSDYAEALPRRRRDYPQIEEAEAMLAAMPRTTCLQRRNRAIFATAFLGALRADTLISLRLGHIEIEAKIIVQDGSVSRTKNAKSLRIRWFPIPETFGQELTAWFRELRDLGAGPDDALFPSGDWLRLTPRARDRASHPVPPMTSTHAASEAFRTASDARYTPHAAKHTIAALRGQLHLTEQQRKAWSQNMGHETEHITDAYYGKLSEDACDLLFEEMANGFRQAEASPLPSEAMKEIGAKMKDFLGALERYGISFDDL